MFRRSLDLRMWISAPRVSLYMFCAIACAIWGCNREPGIKPAAPDVGGQLLKIAAAYSQAMGQWQRPPGKVEELSLLIKQNGDNPAEVLKSPLDGQEFVIIYGIDFGKLAAAGQNPTVVMAYEKMGQAGVRHVLVAPSQVRVMNATEFAAAPFPPGYQPHP
jgi:hypothetical protein